MIAIITGIFKAVIHALGAEWLTSKFKLTFKTEGWHLFLWICSNFIIAFIFTTIIFTVIGYMYVSNLGAFLNELKYLYSSYIIYLSTDEADFITVLRMADIAFFAVCISPVFAVAMVFLRWRRKRDRIKFQLRSYEIEKIDKYVLTTDRIFKYVANMFSGIVCIIDLNLGNLYVIEKINDKAYEYDKKFNLDMPKPMIGESFFTVFYWIDIRKEILDIIKKLQKQTRFFKSFKLIQNEKPVVRKYEIVIVPIGNGIIDRMMIYIKDRTEEEDEGGEEI